MQEKSVSCHNWTIKITQGPPTLGEVTLLHSVYRSKGGSREHPPDTLRTTAQASGHIKLTIRGDVRTNAAQVVCKGLQFGKHPFEP